MAALPTFQIDQDIRRAQTLPSWVYRDPEVLAVQTERVFARAWHLAADGGSLPEAGGASPLVLLPGCLDEPLVLTRDDGGQARCLSNVCTHRGNLVCNAAGPAAHLRCRYHGRSFGLDGSLQHMPSFEDVEGFPAETDDLARLPVGQWGPLTFAALRPHCEFAAWIAPVIEVLSGWAPVAALSPAACETRTYEVSCNWALYCDNFLEGFHIPFVHPGLAQALAPGGYRQQTFPFGSLQTGLARADEPAFELPSSHPDHGARVAAYYFWLFPNTMLNFYPWGLSVNVVRPLAQARTQVEFRSYVWDESLRDQGAGADLDRVEMEDEEVCESVQRGVRSRLYDRGRYAPTQEVCVHHFHRLLAHYMSEPGSGEAAL